MSDTDLAIVVDEQDTVLAYKQRGELTPADRWRVSSIWLKNSQGQILLAQRHTSKTIHGGLWGPSASGTVEKGESYAVNAVKELWEELGVKNVPLKAIGHRPVDGPDSKRFNTWYVGVVDWPAERFVLEPGQVAAVKWGEPGRILADLAAHPEHYVPTAYHWPQLFRDMLAA